MNWYEHHLGDYARDTAHLSMIEEGAYRRLLDRYYATEKPIPVTDVYRVTRCCDECDRHAVDVVTGEFFTLVDGFFIHKRCEEVIAAFAEIKPEMEAKKENAKERQRRSREHRKSLFAQLRSADVVPEYNTPTKRLEEMLSRVTVTDVTRDERVTVTQNVTPETCDDTATQHPLPTTHIEEQEQKHVQRAARFAEWWAVYPIKRAKKDARAKWVSRKLDDRADELIADVTNRIVNDEQWLRGFAPHPATYLNQERWDDELTSPQQHVTQRLGKTASAILELERSKDANANHARPANGAHAALVGPESRIATVVGIGEVDSEFMA